MFQRKKPMPAIFYFRYLLGRTETQEKGLYVDTSTAAHAQPLLAWLEKCKVEFIPGTPLIRKSTLPDVFAKLTQSPALAKVAPLKITKPPAHPLQKTYTLSMLEPSSILQRNANQDEKKQEGDAQSDIVKDLSVAQQKKLLKHKSKTNTPSKQLFNKVSPTACLMFIEGLKTETLASLSTIDQIELLQLSAEKAPEILAELIKKVPYQAFKKAFKSQSHRYDRRTAYHDSAHYLEPKIFLNLIRQSHTNDPKTFFRLLHKQDIDGRTVLHLAAQYQPADVFLELLNWVFKYKDHQCLLMMPTHDQWDLLLLVARYQTADIFIHLLSHLPLDFILKRVTDDKPCSLMAAVAPHDEMLAALSKALGDSAFLSLLNKAITTNEITENPLIIAMHSEKSFALLTALIGKQRVLDVLTKNVANNVKLLLIFLQSPAASESLSRDILLTISYEDLRSGISWRLDKDNIFAGVLCRQTAKVIDIILYGLAPETVERLIVVSFEHLMKKPGATASEKMALVEKLNWNIILDADIFSFLRGVIEPVSLLSEYVAKSIFNVDDNGNTGFHHAVLNEQPKTLIASITQLAELKDKEGFVNTAITIPNRDGETPLHAALKRNSDVALHLIKSVSEKALQSCHNKSKESLLVLAASRSIPCLIRLIEKLDITNEETLLKELSPEAITDILCHVEIEMLFEIIDRKSPRVLYDLFLQKDRRAIAFHRLAAECAAMKARMLFGGIVETDSANYLHDTLLTKNKQGVTLFEQLAILPLNYVHTLFLLQKQDPDKAANLVLEIVQGMLNITTDNKLSRTGMPFSVLPFFLDTITYDTLNKLCHSHNPLTANLLELLLSSNLKEESVRDCFMMLFHKISKENFGILLAKLTVSSFTRLIEIICRNDSFLREARYTCISDLITGHILDVNQAIATPDNVLEVLDYLKKFISALWYSNTAGNLLARIATHCATHSVYFWTADAIVESHLNHDCYHHPGLICDFLNALPIFAFDDFLKNVSINNIFTLFVITLWPRLREKCLDQRVLKFIEEMPLEKHNEVIAVPSDIVEYGTMTDTKYWRLFIPFIAGRAIHKFIAYCSDNILVALAVNAKDAFLNNLGRTNQYNWNVLHHLLYKRNSKTVLAILTQYNARDWEKIDAVLTEQDEDGETSLHTACYRSEEVFALFVKNSSFVALRKAACLVTSAHQETVLEFALPKQTPAVIAALLVKMDYDALQCLFYRKSHDNGRLCFQLACYVIHEPSWQTEDILHLLFCSHAFTKLGMLVHIKRIPSDQIPHAVIRTVLPLLDPFSFDDVLIRGEWLKMMAPLQDVRPTSTAHVFLTRHSFFLPVNANETKAYPYAEEVNQINQLIKENHLAIKMIVGEKNWKDMLLQLSDYHYRPKLRVGMDKTQPVYKFFHMEKDEDKKIRQYEYKKKSEFKTTKKQSVSFIPRTLGTPVFGEQHADRDLVGVLIDFKVEDIKAMFVRDKGTYLRGWVHKDRDVVEKYRRAISEFNCTDFAEFCKEVESHPERLNEMLLALTRQSIKAIVIAKDTPTAKEIAIQRQLDLRKMSINVPIVYYDRLARSMRPLKLKEYAFEQKLKM